MRVLGSTVLVFEWLIVALGVPVAINTAGVPATGAWVFLAVVTALIVLSIATITRPLGVGLGWVVQALILAAGFVVPLLILLAVIFAGLFFVAVQQGRRVDAIRAARTVAPADPEPGGVGDTEPVSDGR
ncbi:MAG: DUF4233 domain-containing protein [Candidatus Nanopelagicales bacterium]